MNRPPGLSSARQATTHSASAAGSSPATCARARSGSGETRAALGGEIGRIDDDEIGGFIDQPRRATALRRKRVGDDNPRARREAIERGVLLGERSERGIDLDEFAVSLRPALQQREANSANAGADIDQPRDRRARRGREQHGVEPDAVAVALLAKLQPAAEDRVEAHRLALSHRRVRATGRLR